MVYELLLQSRKKRGVGNFFEKKISGGRLLGSREYPQIHCKLYMIKAKEHYTRINNFLSVLNDGPF